MKEDELIPIDFSTWSLDINECLNVTIDEDGDILFYYDNYDSSVSFYISVDELFEIVRKTKMFRDRRTVYKEKNNIK